MNESIKESTAAGTTAEHLDEIIKNALTALNNELTSKKVLVPENINALVTAVITLDELKKKQPPNKHAQDPRWKPTYQMQD